MATEIRLAGAEHIEQALSAGNGAVLRIAPFVFGDLIAQIAVHRHSLKASVLIRKDYGPSSSRFGRLILNPIWTSVERRYVRERLVIAPGQVAGTLRELSRRVRSNRLVAIKAIALGYRTYQSLSSMAFCDSHPARHRSPDAAALRFFPFLPFAIRMEVS